MAVEKGILLGSLPLSALRSSGALDAALEKFSRFYLGAEFCDNLLDSSVCGEAAWLQNKGKKVCLLTPMLSERGALRLEALFKKLLGLVRTGKIDPRRLEISVNDFGAVQLARNLSLPFKLNAGRLLRDNVFTLADGAFRAHNGRALDFFRKLGISRFELSTLGRRPKSNFGRGRAYGFDKRRFRITLYYPYFNLTSTRTCMVGMPELPPGVSYTGVNCAQECRIAAYKVAHPAIKEELLVRGNTVFLSFPDKFYRTEAELAGLNIDRLVYAPFP